MTVTVLDSFSGRAEEARRRALENGFEPVSHHGVTYQGISLVSAGVERDLERAVGCPVSIDMEFFRAGLDGVKQPTWIHMDAICSDFACVWYLTPNELCRGGTAFWRHRETGLEGIEQSELTPEFADQINRETHDESKWDLTGMVEMRFNRAAIYPTSRFHSQYPREGFGQSPANGRLVWCSFFSRK